MNEKLLNTQIEALNSKHGAAIVAFYTKEGFNTGTMIGSEYRENRSTYRYYGVNVSGQFDNRPHNSGLKTITLEEAELIAAPYPKVMYVWDGDTRPTNPLKRVVFMEKAGYFIAWSSAETLEATNNVLLTMSWEHAEPVVEEPNLQVSLKEIAAKFGVPVEKLQIVEK